MRQIDFRPLDLDCGVGERLYRQVGGLCLFGYGVDRRRFRSTFGRLGFRALNKKKVSTLTRMGARVRRFLCQTACGFAVLCASYTGAQADSLIRLDKVDRLELGNVILRGCDVDSEQIVTSIKFILNTAQIPMVDRLEVERQRQAITDRPLPKDLDWDKAREEIKRTRQELDKLSFPTLSVVGDILSARAGCIYTVEIEVREYVRPTTLRYSEKQFSGSVPLWQASFHGISPASDLTGSISEGIEAALKEFVNDRAEDMRKAAQLQ